jgi:rubrerythrin
MQLLYVCPWCGFETDDYAYEDECPYCGGEMEDYSDYSD